MSTATQTAQYETWGVTDLPSRDVLDRMLDKTKGRLFFKHGAGYLGSLLCSHEFVWDEDCPTAWCNGDTIGFNPWFFYALDQDGRVTLLAHELWHTGYDHFTRRGERNPDVWNIAGDFIINNDLDKNGYCFKRLLELAPGACLDHQHDNKTTEQIYNEIMKPPQGGNQGSPQQGSGKPGGASDPKSMGGDIRQTGGKDKDGNPTGPSKQDIIGKLVKARQASRMAKEAGVVPSEIEEIIDNFLSPVLPWESLLFRYFSAMDQSDYSWKRPNRRYSDAYLPCMHSDNGLEHLVYYLDVSGSVTPQQAKRFFSEVFHIHQNLAPKKITMITFDTKIHDIFELTDEDSFHQFKIHGRGGTCLKEVQKDIEERKPTAAVIFSDMYVSPMEKNPGSPIIWAVMDNKKAKVPFGTMIHIPKEQMA